MGAFEENLIAQVRGFQLLYNKKDENYYNKIARKNVWIEISNALGKSGECCQNRWKVLRDKFTREVRRMKFSKKNDGKKGTWAYLASMMFLKDHVQHHTLHNDDLNNEISDSCEEPNVSIQENEQEKCGEVFISRSGAVSIQCGFCCECFDEMDIFIEHIKQNHTENSIEKESYNSVDYENEDYHNDHISTYNFGESRSDLSNSNNCDLTLYLTDDDDLGNSSDLQEVLNKKKETNNEPKESGEICSYSHINTDDKSDIKRINFMQECNIDPLHDDDDDDNEYLKYCIEHDYTSLGDDGNKIPIVLQEVKEVKVKEINNKFQNSEKEVDSIQLDIHTIYENDNDEKTKNNDSMSVFVETLENPLICKYCLRKFPSKQKRIDHERSHTGEKPFQCEICYKRFQTRQTYISHGILHQNIKPYKCDLCDLSFPTKSRINMHRRRHLGLRNVACSYCDKKFYYQSEVKEHERIHTGEKPVSCEICDKNFRSKRLYDAHLRVHTGERPYKCTKCDAAFKISSNLNTHMKRHMGIKSFKCSYCDKVFVMKQEKEDHERSHTGEKPYQCFKCGQCFTTNSVLSKHVRKKHEIGVKSFKCDQCDSSFFTKSELSGHYVKHSGLRPFECELCTSNFPRKKALKSHMKIHLKVAEYVCSICGKGFKQSAGLHNHMKIHGQKS